MTISQKATDYGTARYAVVGALETLERLTRPDGIPLGDHVARQVARALRSAADLLDPPAARFEGLLVRENAFVPEGEVWVRPPAALSIQDALVRYTTASARIRAGEPYPACCYPVPALVEMKHVEFSGSMTVAEAEEVLIQRHDPSRRLEREADAESVMRGIAQAARGEGKEIALRTERSHAEGI